MATVVVVSRSPSRGRGSNGLGAAVASAIRGRWMSRTIGKARSRARPPGSV